MSDVAAVPSPPPSPSSGGEGDRVRILGVPIEMAMRAKIIARVRAFLDEPRVRMIATVNPEMLVAARRDRELWEILQKTDLNVMDGMGILLALRWMRPKRGDLSTSFARAHSAQDDRVAERFAGVDLMMEICRICAEEGRSAYLVGGREGAAERAAEALKEKFPGLRVTGAERGPTICHREGRWPSARGDLTTAHDCEIASSADGDRLPRNDNVVARIIAVKPDVLFVAFGHGKQEKWLFHNFLRSTSYVLRPRLVMGVGGAFDMLAGITPRAPLLLRKIGLEWLWRLVLQPRRIRRIITAVFVFPCLVFFLSFRAKSSLPAGRQGISPLPP